MSDFEIPRYERTGRTALERIWSLIESNGTIIILSIVALAGLHWAGIISIGIPGWWPVAALVLVASLGVAYIGSDWIYSDVPEPSKVWVLDWSNRELWKMSPDRYAELDKENHVEEWSGAKERVVEVAEYDRDRDRLIGNWRGVPPASEFGAKKTVEDIEHEIEDVRENLAPLAQAGNLLRQRMGGIARRMDSRRAHALASTRESKTVDRAIDEGDTIEAVLEEQLPDHLNPYELETPDRDDGLDGDTTNGHETVDDLERIDIIGDGDPLIEEGGEA